MNGLDRTKIVDQIRTASHEVFTTMLGLELREGSPYLDRRAPVPKDGLLSFVGFAGRWAGTGGLSCSGDMARQLSAAFLMSPFDAINGEVLDAMAELTNMIFGNLKNALEDDLGPMGLSIPTVIYGRNYVTRTISNLEWIVLPFSYGGEVLEAQLCLVPVAEMPSARASVGNPQQTTV